MKVLIGKKLPLLRLKSLCTDEKGVALVVGLMFVAILALLGTSAVIMTSTDMQIGHNYKTNTKAYNAAQAGIQEALYRLRLVNDGGVNAPPYGSKIVVNNITNDNAAISFDPIRSDGKTLLQNGLDDDGNTKVDDIGDLNYNGTYNNRNWKAVILLSDSSPQGLVNDITFYTNTIQPSTDWIEYSSSTDGETALSIEFLKDSGNMDGDSDFDEIVFYDAATMSYNVEGLAGNHASGKPVFVITSTGKDQKSIKTIRAGVTPKPLDIGSEAALMVNMTPDLTGSALISGFNHMLSTTDVDEKDGSKWHLMTTGESIFNVNGVDNHGGGEDFFYYTSPPKGGKTKGDNPDIYTTLHNYAVRPEPNNEEELEEESRIPYGQKLRTTGHRPGVWTPLAAGTISPDADVFGGDDATLSTPILKWKTEAAPLWLTLAQILGVTEDEKNKILDDANVTYADVDGSGQLSVDPLGVTYIDNAGKGLLKIPNNVGNGLMYITGNVQFQNLVYKGLIYVEGDADVTGSFWLLGTLIVHGDATGDFSAGNGTYLYSGDALSHYVNGAMAWRTLWWKDENVN